MDKSKIMSELLAQLLDEMKVNAGSRLKPKEASIEIISAKPVEHEEPDGDEDKAGLQDHLDSLAAAEAEKHAAGEEPELVALDEPDEDEDEDEDELISPASARLNKILK